MVLVVIAAGAVCFFTRRRVRRYSVDLTHRADEANIPLSALEPELPAEALPPNGLQTFEGTETSAKEPEEPEVKPETQEEQKTEVGEPAVDSSSASAAAAPDSSEDKPKGDGKEESSPADVKPSSEEKTDDEGAASNKTSVESLKETNETNENNSNNTGSSQKTDVQTGNTLQEVCVDCLV
ncbi:protein P54 [Austrofundulus limnaeus]|uniref:Protein P54 n=1 Tax=Austrofundulus limnaeus TaxID=52670 RepID=A0A2I4B6B2_AUSLI|nr:PREDICTED: protein P54-like [Austrofundulus limnaeus]